MRTLRQKAVEREFEGLITKANSGVSTLAVATSMAEELIPWMHDNLLNSKGDLTEANRLELGDQFISVFMQLNDIMPRLQTLFDMYNVDSEVYAQNLVYLKTKKAAYFAAKDL